MVSAVRLIGTREVNASGPKAPQAGRQLPLPSPSPAVHSRRCIVPLSFAMATTDQETGIFVGKSEKPEFLDASRSPTVTAWSPAHRHRQDRDLAGAGGRFLARRRSGVRRRHQRRSLRHRGAGRGQGGLRRARQAIGHDLSARRFPVVFWDMFGEQGHPIRATDGRDGSASAVAAAGPQRCPGRRAQHRLPGRRRQGCCCWTSRICAPC